MDAEKNITRVIVVDLDGTLISTDMLLESFFLFFKTHPFRIFEMFGWLLKGRANFKIKLADFVQPDVSHLPYNKPLITWLKQERETGARLVLATATDLRLAKKVAEHIGIFDEILGTEKDINLSSHNKRQALVTKFGAFNYEYVGNAWADLAVWQEASVIHVANPSFGLLSAANRIGKVANVFDTRSGYFKTLIKALRIHQWLKNGLIFVPLLASHRIAELPLIISGVVAFISFGLCASSVYLLNDLLDLQDDRLHRTKKRRPLAAGILALSHAVLLIPMLLLISISLALWYLPSSFIQVLGCYYFLTLIYSLWLKKVVMLDVIILALLYTIRVIAGASAMSLEATFWILAFCVFIFLSLAFVKRYTELCDARQNGLDKISSQRGYCPADFELLASLGGSAGYISVMILALYINDVATGMLYQSQKWLWAACPLLLFWLSRVWLLAHRGQMHDDPIVFALRDRISLLVGFAFLVIFALATHA